MIKLNSEIHEQAEEQAGIREKTITIYVLNYFEFVPASNDDIQGEGESQDKRRKTRKYKPVCFVMTLYYDKKFRHLYLPIFRLSLVKR